jgi:DNA-directed RNA polymerase sigma subunit (sigma70/sigma32)
MNFRSTWLSISKKRNAPAGMAGEDSDTSIKVYLREIGQIPLLTPQEEIDLAARIKKGDREARALMIKANLRLVVKIAHDYANWDFGFGEFVGDEDAQTPFELLRDENLREELRDLLEVLDLNRDGLDVLGFFPRPDAVFAASDRSGPGSARNRPVVTAGLFRLSHHAGENNPCSRREIIRSR